MYLDANNLYGWLMPQRLPVNYVEWIKQLSELDERFKKIMVKVMIKGIFLK